jgi:hypothetical protein
VHHIYDIGYLGKRHFNKHLVQSKVLNAHESHLLTNEYFACEIFCKYLVNVIEIPVPFKIVGIQIFIVQNHIQA